MCMRRKALRWTLFLAGLLILLQGASWVVTPKDNTAEAGMEQVKANGILGEPANTIDILVLGDSESYTAISPLLLWNQTGYTSYVCGTSGQKLSYTKTMLQRAFQRQKPKLVILETLAIYRPMTLGSLFVDEVSPYLPLLRYHDRWKSLSWRDLTGPVTYTGTDSYKGHRHSKAALPCEPGEYMKPTEHRASVPLVNRMYVNMLQRICRKNGAELLLVSTPSPVNWNYRKHNGIQALASELGCRYVDLNLEDQRLKIDWTQDTYDKGDHLNHYGAVKVTTFLGELLQQSGTFADHRSDPSFLGWEQAWKSYEKAVQS